MSRNTHRLHEICVEFKHETAKAVLYNDGKKDFWVPKSALAEDGYIQTENNKDGTITLTATEGWLTQRGLI